MSLGRRPVLTALMAATLITPLVGGSAAAAAPSVSCGDVVTGDVVLSSDVVCGEGVALTVAADAVIDLNGYSLVGPGSSSASTGVLVERDVEGEWGVTIVRGTLRGWGNAVLGSFDSASAFADVTIDRVGFEDNGLAILTGRTRATVTRSSFEGNGRGLNAWPGSATVASSTFSGNGRAASVGDASGLSIDRATFQDNDTAVNCSQALCNVTASTFRGNGTGVAVFWSVGTIDDNRFTDNTRGVSLSLDSREVVESNTFDRNHVGVEARFGDRSTVRNNTFRGNGTGLLNQVLDSGEAVTTVQDNTFAGNGDGIYVENPGISLGGNSAVRNSGWGIYAPGALDLGGNTARRNGNEPQCVGVVC